MVTWLVLLLAPYIIDIIIQSSAAIQSLAFGALILKMHLSTFKMGLRPQPPAPFLPVKNYVVYGKLS